MKKLLLIPMMMLSCSTPKTSSDSIEFIGSKSVVSELSLFAKKPCKPVCKPEPRKPKPRKPTKPTPKPGGCSVSRIDQAMLTAVNVQRKKGAVCGGTSYRAAPALVWNCSLIKASRAHSTDMHTKNFMSHTGSDGSKFSTRTSRHGYGGGYQAENIAKGYTSVTHVMKGWMGSAGHCKNIMGSNYKYLGFGVVGRSWTQNFGG